MMMATADDYITQANHIDFDDCAKKTLCLLAAKKKGIESSPLINIPNECSDKNVFFRNLSKIKCRPNSFFNPFCTIFIFF